MRERRPAPARLPGVSDRWCGTGRLPASLEKSKAPYKLGMKCFDASQCGHPRTREAGRVGLWPAPATGRRSPPRMESALLLPACIRRSMIY